MASQYSVSTGTAALTASTARVMIELPTGSTKGLVVVGLEVTLSATSAGSCTVEWMTFATSGTATTTTPLKYGTDQGPAAIMGTVKINNTVAPGTLASGGLPSWECPLPGFYSLLQPLYREFYQPVSTNRCIRLTSTIACNARVDLFFEQ